jgi:hypothetical protein
VAAVLVTGAYGLVGKPVVDRGHNPSAPLLGPSDVVTAAFPVPRQFGGSPSGVDLVASAALCRSL